jgi:hypothetical protein
LKRNNKVAFPILAGLRLAIRPTAPASRNSGHPARIAGASLARVDHQPRPPTEFGKTLTYYFFRILWAPLATFTAPAPRSPSSGAQTLQSGCWQIQKIDFAARDKNVNCSAFP